MSESPLSSTDPDALTLVFSSDPLELSDAQLLQAIQELRRRRSLFASEEAAKALKPKSARVRAEPSTAESAINADKPLSEVSLDDLD